MTPLGAIDLARYLSRFQVRSGWVFYPAATLFVSYLLYTMIRRRRGERPGSVDREADL